ncbi:MULTISPECIES: AAA-like domain-containing protein [unclassified Moorena]|uniref:AAA-like domain-containing protein n=1 Tax=unclassified Moorena TaxID=2683338 RepID=UPI0013CD9807|nr:MULTISPECIES: AAA-like domain-containing protein [unclassified Moorena]NEO22702.1 protein kinase [Moorena sp. SIO4A5]NEQ55899.1 protein kinase [Moorena sp. SIO4A1]
MKTNKHRSVCGKLKQQLNNRVKRWFNSPKNGHSSTTQPIAVNVAEPYAPYKPPSTTQPPNHSNGVGNNTWLPGYRLQNGKYTIEKKLGEGGLGITYLARNNKTGDRIVIKTIGNDALRQNNLLEYWKIFANEAVKLAQCSCGNPHLVSLCEEIIREGELPCLIMEYIEGETLSALVKRQGVLSEEKALLYIQQIGSALWDIHQQGLLHRDVKPNNIMVRNDGSGAVLIDLGIATKFVPGVTQTHLCGRTPGYAPLEQYEWRSQQGPYTDVYALAATLYVLLTGKKPVSADDRIEGAVLPPPKDLNPKISDRINQAILHGMNLVARDRPQSIPEFLNLLDIELPNNNSTNSTNNQPQTIAQVGDFYIERPQDAECYQKISQPGALIRIKAPKLMGKTLLSHRILDYAKSRYYRTVYLNLNELPCHDLDIFLQSFCVRVAQKLKLPNQLQNYWEDNFFTSEVKCSTYFEEYLLVSSESPLVLCLDNLERVFPHQHVAEGFLTLLRSWHENGQFYDIWKRLRLIVVYATEVYIDLAINKSPFNVGYPIDLTDFTLNQVQDLAKFYGLNLSVNLLHELMSMVGGHPYLLQLAFSTLSKNPNITIEHLLETAPTESGIYRHHLRELLNNLMLHPNLLNAFKKLLTTTQAVRLDYKVTYLLESLGLVRAIGNDCIPRYNLYREYFSNRLL